MSDCQLSEFSLYEMLSTLVAQEYHVVLFSSNVCQHDNYGIV